MVMETVWAYLQLMRRDKLLVPCYSYGRQCGP